MKAMARHERLGDEELAYSCPVSVRREDQAKIRKELIGVVEKFLKTVTAFDPPEILARHLLDILALAPAELPLDELQIGRVREVSLPSLIAKPQNLGRRDLPGRQRLAFIREKAEPFGRFGKLSAAGVCGSDVLWTEPARKSGR
jgi:hypothetical protein